MDNRYIGVFDSGLGGLTAVKELMRGMPNENIVYFGDTGRVPYGNKSKETVIKYAKSDIRFLLTYDVKIIVVACGTASSIALPDIKSSFDLPMFGVVDTAVGGAIAATKNKKIGILGTQSTIKSGAYETLIHSLDKGIKTVSVPCPMFVPLVENGYLGSEVTYSIAKEYLAPLIKEGVDTVILGCTHYPLLKPVIQNLMGEDVALIDSGSEIAKHVKQVLTEGNMLADTVSKDQYMYFVSDSVEGFAELGSKFLDCEIRGHVKKIEIEQY